MDAVFEIAVGTADREIEIFFIAGRFIEVHGILPLVAIKQFHQIQAEVERCAVDFLRQL